MIDDSDGGYYLSHLLKQCVLSQKKILCLIFSVSLLCHKSFVLMRAVVDAESQIRGF